MNFAKLLERKPNILNTIQTGLNFATSNTLTLAVRVIMVVGNAHKEGKTPDLLEYVKDHVSEEDQAALDKTLIDELMLNATATVATAWKILHQRKQS